MRTSRYIATGLVASPRDAVLHLRPLGYEPDERRWGWRAGSKGVERCQNCEDT